MPVKRAHDRIAHQPRLVWQEGKRERDLRGVGAKVAPDAPEVAGPRDAARVHQQARGYMQVNREGDDQENKETPEPRRTGKQRTRRDQPDE